MDVYIGNLAPGVTRAELKHLAVQFGVILNVKWWPRGSYAFVQARLYLLITPWLKPNAAILDV